MTENNKQKKSALKVKKGVEQPSTINVKAVQKFMHKKHDILPVEKYIDGILSNNRTILSQAITLIESSLPKHQEIAQQIIKKCLPHSGNSIRVGVTGVPGVGKSLFIEALGKYITNFNRKLAVLAIDPSSERSKGSILGDKTRMEELSVDENAFIRPSPSAGSLGGVARKTREIIIICEAAGFDTIFIETVGVGQSETAVHSMVDFFLLLMLAGAGDELQGIKRGIIEMSDAIFINKADGDNIEKAQFAKNEFQNALHLFPPAESKWTAVTDICSSLTKNGIDRIWETILKYETFTKQNGYFYKKRKKQENYRMFETIDQSLKDKFYHNPEIQRLLLEAEKDIQNNNISSYVAAQKMLDFYFRKIVN